MRPGRLIRSVIVFKPPTLLSLQSSGSLDMTPDAMGNHNWGFPEGLSSQPGHFTEGAGQESGCRPHDAGQMGRSERVPAGEFHSRVKEVLLRRLDEPSKRRPGR